MSTVRYSVESPAGKENLEILADAVEIMKQLPATDPHSWAYQAGLHGTSNDELKDSRFINTCPHYQNSPNDAAHFLAWHRLYLHYFEETVRSISGRSDFSVPYWDYSDPDQTKLPTAFLSPSAGGMTALYQPGRTEGLNEGNDFDENVIISIREGIKNLEEEKGSPFFTFSHSLESNPHNLLHGALGGLMGRVPTAALDPIFWVHHANIDRLWAENSNQRLTTELLGSQPAGQTYGFFDANKNPIELSYEEAANLSHELAISYNTALSPLAKGNQEEALLDAEGLIYTQAINQSIGQLRTSDLTLRSAFNAIPRDGESTLIELNLEVPKQPSGGYIDIFFGDTSEKQNELLNGTNQSFEQLFLATENEDFLTAHYTGSLSFDFAHGNHESSEAGVHSEHSKEEDVLWADITSEVIAAANDPLINDFLHFHVDQDQDDLSALEGIIVKSVNFYQM